MEYITQDGITYQYVPGGKRFIYPGEHWIGWSGCVHIHDGHSVSSVKYHRVIPIKRVEAKN